MLKVGVIQLPKNIKFFPPLKDNYTDEEKQHMLVIVGFNTGEGLSLLQSVPGMLEENKVISYAEKHRAAINLVYPMIDTAMNKEYVHARVITMLNDASADQEKPNYKVTFVFICDKDNKNFKLADIFTGDTDQGSWASAEMVKGIAAALNMPVYKSAQDVDGKEEESK